MRAKSITPAALLIAAGRVVMQAGVEGLTLESVAKEAGVSKGGLLYHFHSKEALLVGMVELLIAEFEQLLAAELAQEPDQQLKGAWLRAYIRAVDTFDQEYAALQSGLLAAVSKNAALLQPLKAANERWWQQACRGGAQPVKVGVIMVALDGLSLNQLFDTICISEQERAAVIAELIQMTHTLDSLP